MDDDVYLNVPRLVEMLQGYNHREDWYLGKPSLKHPLEVTDRETPGVSKLVRHINIFYVFFFFFVRTIYIFYCSES